MPAVRHVTVVSSLVQVRLVGAGCLGCGWAQVRGYGLTTRTALDALGDVEAAAAVHEDATRVNPCCTCPGVCVGEVGDWCTVGCECGCAA